MCLVNKLLQYIVHNNQNRFNRRRFIFKKTSHFASTLNKLNSTEIDPFKTGRISKILRIGS